MAETIRNVSRHDRVLPGGDSPPSENHCFILSEREKTVRIGQQEGVSGERLVDELEVGYDKDRGVWALATQSCR